MKKDFYVAVLAKDVSKYVDPYHPLFSLTKESMKLNGYSLSNLTKLFDDEKRYIIYKLEPYTLYDFIKAKALDNDSKIVMKIVETIRCD